jgi:phage virion morphogenesis protein
MAEFTVRIDEHDFKRLNKRIAELLHDALHLEPIYAEAAEYMKRSTVNRILRSKNGPNGERWKALEDVTVNLKGNDTILFQEGALAESIRVDEVTNDGFVLGAHAKHASTMQDGFYPTTGMIKGKRIPPRPFMGFSDENKRRIAIMIRDYLAHGGD